MHGWRYIGPWVSYWGRGVHVRSLTGKIVGDYCTRLLQSYVGWSCKSTTSCNSGSDLLIPMLVDEERSNKKPELTGTES
jgi:hypothetical protein